MDIGPNDTVANILGTISSGGEQKVQPIEYPNKKPASHQIDPAANMPIYEQKPPPAATG